MSTCRSVSSSRYDAQGGIEVISPANSPARREEKNEGPFQSEKSSGETSNPWWKTHPGYISPKKGGKLYYFEN